MSEQLVFGTDDLQPWIVLQDVSNGNSSLGQVALWRTAGQTHGALAMFSDRTRAETYAKVFAGEDWQVIRPAPAALVQLLIECFRSQVKLAVLDPDATTARSVFDLRQVLLAVREQLQKNTGPM